MIRSDGKYVRDYFYVEDGAATYTLLVERLAQDRALQGESFNFSNETPTTVLALVEKILKEMGSDLEPEIRNEAVNEIREQYLSAAKARRMLQWKPVFTLDQGLRLTIDWYRTMFEKAG